MIGDPQVLILDEPANGLDPEGIKWRREFAGLAAPGRTVLVSSHLPTEMEVLADALVIIAAGNLVAHGTLEQILTSSGTGVVVHVRTPNVTELTTAVTGRGGTVTATSNGRLRITGVSAAAVGNAAAAIGVELHDLRTHRAYLRDVFLEPTGGQAAIR